MKMCCNEALIMPSSYAVMNEEEMTYVEGGGIYLTKNMLNKSYCKKIAAKYTTSTGLSQTRIAKEIFSHAVLFLAGRVGAVLPIAKNIPLAQQTIAYIINHSNPVDLGGDPWYRVAVYDAIWVGIPNLV